MSVCMCGGYEKAIALNEDMDLYMLPWEVVAPRKNGMTQDSPSHNVNRS